MRKAKVSEFRRLYYSPDSAPAAATVRARIDRKEIAGGMVEGGRYYVDLDAYEQEHQIAATARARVDELGKSTELAGLI